MLLPYCVWQCWQRQVATQAEPLMGLKNSPVTFPLTLYRCGWALEGKKRVFRVPSVTFTVSIAKPPSWIGSDLLNFQPRGQRGVSHSDASPPKICSSDKCVQMTKFVQNLYIKGCPLLTLGPGPCQGWLGTLVELSCQLLLQRSSLLPAQCQHRTGSWQKERLALTKFLRARLLYQWLL